MVDRRVVEIAGCPHNAPNFAVGQGDAVALLRPEGDILAAQDAAHVADADIGAVDQAGLVAGENAEDAGCDNVVGSLAGGRVVGAAADPLDGDGLAKIAKGFPPLVHGLPNRGEITQSDSPKRQAIIRAPEASSW